MCGQAPKNVRCFRTMILLASECHRSRVAVQSMPSGGHRSSGLQQQADLIEVLGWHQACEQRYTHTRERSVCRVSVQLSSTANEGPGYAGGFGYSFRKLPDRRETKIPTRNRLETNLHPHTGMGLCHMGPGKLQYMRLGKIQQHTRLGVRSGWGEACQQQRERSRGGSC